MPSPFDLNQKLMWMTRGANCSMCNAMRGRVYTQDMWMSASVWPGFHVNCDCYLKKVGAEVPESDPDIFGGSLHLYLEDWHANLPGFLSLLQWHKNFEPTALTTIHEIEKAHLRYGADLPIGQVLKLMKEEFIGFFKRSTIWDDFFSWRVLRTMQHYECIDDTYCGTKPPGFRGLWRFKERKPPSLLYPNYFKYATRSNLINQFKPDTLNPWDPKQTWEYNHGR